MRTAIYKGKRYKLHFLGSTRYGMRAKLGFFSGWKSFWVDAHKVREEHPEPKPVVENDDERWHPTDEPEPPYEDEFDMHMAEVAAENKEMERLEVATVAPETDDIPF